MTGSLLSGCGGHSGTSSNPGTNTSCAKITDIDHVVIFIQENRSFDHYFGSYRGVRGFSDRARPSISPILPTHPARPRGASAFPPRHHANQRRLHPRHYSRLDPAAPELEQRCHGRLRHLAPAHQCQRRRALHGLLHPRRPALLLCGRRCVHPLRQLLLFRHRPHRSQSPLHNGRLHRSRWQKWRPVLQTLVTNRSSMFGKLTYTTMPEQLQTRRHLVEDLFNPRRQRIRLHRNRQRPPLFQKLPGPRPALLQNAFNPVFPPTSLPDALAGKSTAGLLDNRIRRHFRPSPISRALRREYPLRTSSPHSPQIPSRGRRLSSSLPTMKMAASSITSRRLPPLQEPPGNTSRLHPSPTPLSKASSTDPSDSASACPCSSSRPSAAAASFLLTSSTTPLSFASSRHASAQKFPIFPHGAALPSAI